MDEQSKEDSVMTTLNVVSAAAAAFPPWGTVAAVVIQAGIAIFKFNEAQTAAQLAFEKALSDAVHKADYIHAMTDTFARAKSRPTMPLDLYAGPPMYWIVPSNPNKLSTDPKNEWYKLATGNVEWPCGLKGGKTPMTDTNTTSKPIDVDDVFAPFAPTVNSNPTVCVFFWAVPIFFARVQQLLQDQMFPKSTSPKEIDLKSGKTIEARLAEIIKGILLEGYLDGAGNWFGKIGSVILPIAKDDIDFAPRYYGRSLWVHNLAMQNIKFIDGSRIASSGIQYSTSKGYFDNQLSQFTKDQSQNLLSYDRRFMIAKGNPYFIKSLTVQVGTPTPVGGYVIDKKELLSRYDAPNSAQDRAKFQTDNTQDSDSVFYVVVAKNKNAVVSCGSHGEGLKELYVRKVRQQTNTEVLNDQIQTYPYGFIDISLHDVYRGVIRGAGGYRLSGNGRANQIISAVQGPETMDVTESRFHGKFALAPFMLYIRSKCEPVFGIDGMHPRPYIGPSIEELDETQWKNHTTYGFMDFDPSEFKTDSETPGISNGDIENIKQYDWIRNLAIMPKFNIKENATPDDLNYENQQKKIYNESSWLGGAANSQSLAWKEEAMRYDTFLTESTSEGQYNSIIKLRPPMQGEQTVKLTKEFWGEGAAWAKKLNKTEVDFAILPISSLTVFKIKRCKLNGININSNPVTSAYYRTNLEENKPIVEVDGYPTPSPFYCGRRADPRTQPAWKKIRDASLGDQAIATDTGWEDCHEWSWPYKTSTLSEIGRISLNLYNNPDLKEGIGRAGLSPSAIATGPTLFGDSVLYISRFKSMSGASTDVNSPEFAKMKAKTMWQSIIEMQTGAYSRYSYMKNNLNDTFFDNLQKEFGRYSDNKTARQAFLDDANKAIAKGNPPQVQVAGGGMKIVSAADAAEACIQVIDKWFNGTFPKPTTWFESRVSGSDWNPEALETVATAHIKLKNWALDLGKPADERTGVAFPSEYFTINFFGLNQAARIAIESYNSIVDEKFIVTNPIQIGINQILHPNKNKISVLDFNRMKPKSSTLNPPVLMTAAATLATIAIIARLKGRK